MGSKNRRHGGSDQTDWANERTLAEAEEADALERGAEEPEAGPAPTSCVCGSREFVLEAFMHVVEGRIRPEPVDVESVTCPRCGREFEAIEGEGGTILRGEFRGVVDLDEDE